MSCESRLCRYGSGVSAPSRAVGGRTEVVLGIQRSEVVGFAMKWLLLAPQTQIDGCLFLKLSSSAWHGPERRMGVLSHGRWFSLDFHP